MPREQLTFKQEKFCQELIVCGSGPEAYRKAYNTKTERDATVHDQANKLLKHPAVLARMNELRDKSVQVAVFGLDEAMKEAKEAFDLAKEIQSPAAMVAATQLRSKLAGILIERRENTNKNSVRDLTDEELEKKIAETAKEGGYVLHRVK